MDSRGDPNDAQGAVRDHAQIHANSGLTRARHDVPNLHCASEPRLRQRGRHDQEVSRLASSATDSNCPLRQLTLQGGEAKWLPVVSFACVDRYRQRPNGDFAVCLRRVLLVRALRSVRAGCAHVLHLSQWNVFGRNGVLLQRLFGREVRSGPGRVRYAGRLGTAFNHSIPGSASEKIHRNAGGRWGCMAAAVCAAGFVGGPPLRRGVNQRGLRTSFELDARGARADASGCRPTWLEGEVQGWHAAGHCKEDAGPLIGWLGASRAPRRNLPQELVRYSRVW
mmetsp:Transcript_10104/g.36956  ORF Transcript_10104/g.36956 Transcript_10104/m.36956 type:complete len:280 (-) Transcript_10104:277-1116(-)